MIIRDNFCEFCIETFAVTPHLNCLICCDPSSEQSRRDGSDEGSQHTVSMRNEKNYHQILPLIQSSG